MHYTLNQLMIYHRICQLGSITRAAEELHLTQPAVSIQLRKFQDQFQIPLTEVIGRKLYVTDFGQEIARAAEKILKEVEAIDHRMMAYRGYLAGKLKISSVSTGKYVIPFFLTDFMNAHPGVELKLDVTNKAMVIDSLRNNEVDFGFVSVLPDQLPVDKVELLRNQLFLVGQPQEKFSKHTNDRSLLKKLPLIFREAGSGTRHTMEKFLERSQLNVKMKLELTSNEAVKQAVIAGLGYSIMPLIGIHTELSARKLQIIPVKGLPIQSSWNLIWLKGKQFSPIAEQYLKFLKEANQKIIAARFAWLDAY